MVSHPDIILLYLKQGRITKRHAIDLLKSLINGTDDEPTRLNYFRYIEKCELFTKETYKYLEYLLISDQSPLIRRASAKFISNHFLKKALSPMKWALDNENDLNCLSVVIKSLTKINSFETRQILLRKIRQILETEYLDVNGQYLNHKFRKILKSLIDSQEIDTLSQNNLGEIIINFLIISELINKFYYVYYELNPSTCLITKLDLSDIEYEVRGWKSEFRNNISRLEEINGLTSLKTLEFLDLSNNSIEDIKEMSDLPNLKYLYLSNNRIQNIENLRYLKSLSKLRYLDLKGNDIIKKINKEDFKEDVQLKLVKNSYM